MNRSDKFTKSIHHDYPSRRFSEYIKQRRARNLLVKMVDDRWLNKEGASRSTVYVINHDPV